MAGGISAQRAIEGGPAMPPAKPEDWILTPGELERWVKGARQGERLIYAGGLQLVRGATAELARKLAADEEVTLNQRRAASGGFEYLATRNRIRVAAPRPAQAGPVLDPAMSALMLKLKMIARQGGRCPSDAALGEAIGLSKPQVKWALRKLVAAHQIRTRVVPTAAESKYRIVTIVASGLETLAPPKAGRP